MMEWGPIKFLVMDTMMPFLKFSYTHIFPNYGVSIILLTVLIKLLFFPLMNKQFESMKAMQRLNPQMQKIREKYKNDPQRVQREMMTLYKKHNINPLKGCLPMIVQIPFFLAIYATIISEEFKTMIFAEGANPSFLPFWLPDLSAPDPTFLLPILLAVFTYYSQKMIMTDPQQQKFVWMSPVLILAFGLKLPSGVLLYWAVSTLLSTLQQYMVLKPVNLTGVGKVEVIPANK